MSDSPVTAQLPAPPPAAADAEYERLHAACAALGAELRARDAEATDVDATERTRLKTEIAALIRAAQARARAYAALVDDAKSLVTLWKALPTAADAAPGRDDRRGQTPTPDASDVDAEVGASAPCRVTTRADHLGASTYAAKAWSAYAVGDYEAAEAGYAHAVGLAPHDPELTALHAWALAALGRSDDALLAAQHVLTGNAPAGASALARVALGRACLHKGITGEALEHLTRAARDDADRRATLYATFHLGVAYGSRGMYDDAVTFLRRAAALGPNLVEAQYELGRAHWRAGARAAAHKAWRAGAASGKFSPWAARCDDLRLRMEQGGELPDD